MDDHATQGRVEALCSLCRAGGLALTPQRRAILRALVDLDDHPSADRIYEILRGRQLRVSRATVFRALESLAGHGVIRKASSAGGAVRYDGRASRHHHLVCMHCDRITDFSDEDFDALPFPDTRRFGFQVLDLQVELRGVCRQCRELEDER